MVQVIDRKFNILGMDGEHLIANGKPNGKFLAYQVLKLLWHPFSWPILPVLIVVNWWRKRHFRYWLTNKRLIVSSGIFGVKTQSLPLEKISDVELQKTFLMRLLGTTCLAVTDVSGTGGCLVISIDSAQELQISILEAAERIRVK